MFSDIRCRSKIGCALLSLLAFQVGCRVWIEKPLQPDSTIGVGRHRIVRVITNDDDTVAIQAVTFTNDSIVGLDSRSDRRVAIARQDVRVVEVGMDGTPRWVRIGWKIYLGVLFGLFVAMAVAAGQMHGGI